MKTIDLIMLSIRNFRSRRSRIVLTVAGVSVGIAVIMFLVSVGYGLQRTILDRITTAEALLTLDVTSPDNNSVQLTAAAAAEIADIENVQEVSPRVSVSSLVSLDGLNSQTTVNLVDAGYFNLTGLRIGGGRLFSENDSGVVVITETVANLVGYEKDAIIGKTIDFTLMFPAVDEDQVPLEGQLQPIAQSFEVIGVLDSTADNTVFMPLDDMNDTVIVSFDLVKVQVDTGRNLETVRGVLTEKGFVVSALSDLAEQANQVFTILQIILSIFGVFSLLVAAIGLVNTMTVSLLERTNEIGIMRAIGAAKGDIQKLFLIESSLIGLAGGIAGLVIGWFSGWIFNIILNIVIRTLGGASVDVFATPIWFVVLVMAASIVVGFFSGFFPARRAAELNTLTALRYK